MFGFTRRWFTNSFFSSQRGPRPRSYASGNRSRQSPNDPTISSRFRDVWEEERQSGYRGTWPFFLRSISREFPFLFSLSSRFSLFVETAFLFRFVTFCTQLILFCGILSVFQPLCPLSSPSQVFLPFPATSPPFDRSLPPFLSKSLVSPIYILSIIVLISWYAFNSFCRSWSCGVLFRYFSSLVVVAFPLLDHSFRPPSLPFDLPQLVFLFHFDFILGGSYAYPLLKLARRLYPPHPSIPSFLVSLNQFPRFLTFFF